MTFLTLDDFNFEYPEYLVAQKPLEQRDQSKILIRSHNGVIQHDVFASIWEFIPEDSLILYNDSKVIPARIQSKFVSGGSFEIFLNRCTENMEQKSVWEVIGKPLHKLLNRKKINFQDNLEIALSVHPKDSRLAIATINKSSEEVIRWLEKYARMPLPPYIRRDKMEDTLDSIDKDRYQCVYANKEGSVAAPTAGLHFTDSVIEKLKAKSIKFYPVTLHVGAGTFLPVQTENPSAHVMHEETYSICEDTLKEIIRSKKEGRLIVAVGTTSFRAVESFFREKNIEDEDSILKDADRMKSSNLFIYPKIQDELFKPNIVDALITNFHQPKSTLFMLISALIGLESAKSMYKVAFERDYRLFSYGDSSILFLK